MTLRNKTMRSLAIGLMAQLAVVTGLTGYAQAKLLSTNEVVAAYSAHADREFLLSEIQREEIREKIESLGVNPAEAEARLAALSDAEISDIVARIDSDPAGADAVGAIVGAALTVFIILLVTDLLCLTNVFKFTRCQIN